MNRVLPVLDSRTFQLAGESRIVDHCGLFGVFGADDTAMKAYYGLYAQQHRGQESAGICVSDGKRLTNHTGMGLVSQVFTTDALGVLRGRAAIGHVRYSTTGSSCSANAQPMLINYSQGQVAVAHNGNLVNAAELRGKFERRGAIFQTTSDTEVILHHLAHPKFCETSDPLANVLRELVGAFCLLFIFPDRIEAVRDRHGLRPLCIGRLPCGAHVVASETCALDIIDARYVRDVAPGEIVTLSDKGLSSRFFVEKAEVNPGHCIFEQVYFADPSSNVFGQNVHLFRAATGRRLAIEAPVEGDVVIPVPNCARCAAQGYSDESGIPIGRGFTVSHYAGRSFIKPTQSERQMTVRMKLNVIREAIAGKRLIVIEDSVVRGTTTSEKMGALRRAGAKEIHLRVASPPIRDACYFGIDFPDPSKLIATTRSVEEIRAFLGVDSLAYLSMEGMLECARQTSDNYCASCFAGRSPIQVTTPTDKLALEPLRSERL